MKLLTLAELIEMGIKLEEILENEFSAGNPPRVAVLKEMAKLEKEGKLLLVEQSE